MLQPNKLPGNDPRYEDSGLNAVQVIVMEVSQLVRPLHQTTVFACCEYKR